ncbi:MAG: hypothetical protein ABEJ87_05670 [Candidatus Nanohalobium sp.]
MDRKLVIASLLVLVVLSSGCVADNVDPDSLPGKVLNMFGDFSTNNNSTTYEFSLDSLTNNSVMGPLHQVVDRFKKNMSARGLDVKSTHVKINDISSDRAEFTIVYRAESNSSNSFERNVTMTLVKKDGQWQLKDPFKENINGSYYDSKSYR